ncbi:hypothetical protein AAFF_G00140330 [Aldrovandia affinis]|uniref:Uncharacterized protein n=1 Tax=Aldrovandia affinis TaxID=143900 RepID=A0AAD7TCA8_9TELE|nr:hypothetical protein AAFF_G00140330 [Aldrovandia affinis]
MWQQSQFAQESHASEVHNSQRALEKSPQSPELKELFSFHQPISSSRTNTTARSPDTLPRGPQYLQTLGGDVVNEPAGRSPSLEQTLAEEPCLRRCQATPRTGAELPASCARLHLHLLQHEMTGSVDDNDLRQNSDVKPRTRHTTASGDLLSMVWRI